MMYLTFTNVRKKAKQFIEKVRKKKIIYTYSINKYTYIYFSIMEKPF